MFLSYMILSLIQPLTHGDVQTIQCANMQYDWVGRIKKNNDRL